MFSQTSIICDSDDLSASSEFAEDVPTPQQVGGGVLGV